MSNLLRVGHHNAVSVAKIYRIVKGADMDIVAVSETNMKKDTFRNKINMTGYRLFCRDHAMQTEGGCNVH